MSESLVRPLIYKDWYLNRWIITAFVVAGLVSLVPLASGGEGGFYLGGVLLITILISIGVTLTMVTVINERREHTLAFVMSLPVSPRQYITAKLLANVLIYGSAWAILVVGTVAVLAGSKTLPHGLIPFALVVLGEIFFGYGVMLCVALISESLPWTVGAIVAGNLLVQWVMYWISNVPQIARDMKTDRIIWRPEIGWTLLCELVGTVFLLVITFWLQSRKSDFL
jgi:ABC-2 type transport system permease protein